MEWKKIDWKKSLNNFLFPNLNRRFALRLIAVVLFCVLFFKFVCKPVWLSGGSMEPNYHSGTLNFCWTPTYWFHSPRAGDVVALRYEGDRVMLLKRIVAGEGDVVEFRNGTLLVNGEPKQEPYVKFNQGRWNLPPRKVAAGYVYVIGDNRGMPIEQHKFGQIRKSRIQGTLLL